MSLYSNFNTHSELLSGSGNRNKLDILIYKNRCVIIIELQYKIELKVSLK